jgi:amidase
MSEFPGTAVDLQTALRTGGISAREIAEHFLGRIAERPDLGAFVTVTAEQALAEASAADARFAALTPEERAVPGALPALHGLPIAHKDLVEVAGAPTTRGTAALPAAVAEHDHTGVAVLRAAGTVSLGKTQVPELGLNAYSENLVAAPARSPPACCPSPRAATEAARSASPPSPAA